MDIINQQLFELSDASYRDFHSKLIPNIEKERIIGVRTPVLRKYARELSKESLVNDFLNELPHYYYEENNLHAFILSLKKGDITEIIHEIESFLPYIDNWATCDMFSPKIFKKYPALIYDKCMEWIKSEKTYTVRFAIVTLMNLYLDENYRKEILDVIADIHSEEYYINMAIAWFFSYALIKRYDDTIPLFTEKRLDKWVHNKSLQKAIESLRIAGDTKAYLRTLKIR
jgi:3-methyladenine DNA glycosylase AlkD